jgi:hypothetical protein
VLGHEKVEVEKGRQKPVHVAIRSTWTREAGKTIAGMLDLCVTARKTYVGQLKEPSQGE